MLEDPRLNRFDDPLVDRNLAGQRLAQDEESGWGVFAALAAVVIVIGGLFLFSWSGDRNTTTANYQPPASTTVTPAPAPAPRPNPTPAQPPQ